MKSAVYSYKITMNIIRFLILFIATVTIGCCMATKSFGQCEIKYSHTITNASANGNDGQIDISFDTSGNLPECQIFGYTGNTPFLLMDASKRTDKGKVTFYGLAPGNYTIRMGKKGCKASFIGQHTRIIVGINQGR
jgi:hypothetical protein